MDKIKNKIITISGEPVSGKSTVVREIKNKYDAIYSEETFRQGVAFGVKFTAEVFLLGE